MEENTSLHRNVAVIDLEFDLGRLFVVDVDRKGNKQILTSSSFSYKRTDGYGQLYFDPEAIVKKSITALKKALYAYPTIEDVLILGLGEHILTMSGDKILSLPYVKDKRVTPKLIRELNLKCSFPLRYEISGFNEDTQSALYRLYADFKEKKIDKADKFFYLPEYLYWALTHDEAHDLYLAASGGFLDARRRLYSKSIINGASLPMSLFKPLKESCVAKADTCRDVSLQLNKVLRLRLAGDTVVNAFYGEKPLVDTLYLYQGAIAFIGALTKGPALDDSSRKLGFNNFILPEGNALVLRLRPLHIWNMVTAYYGKSLDDLGEIARNANFFDTFDPFDPVFENPKDLEEEVKLYFRDKEMTAPKDSSEVIASILYSCADALIKQIRQYEAITYVSWRNIRLNGLFPKCRFIDERIASTLGKKVSHSEGHGNILGAISCMLVVEKKEKEIAEREAD